jgi:peptidoglycan/xylan/chitin deacetylase (PgdA/CDA1 family)
VNQIVSLLFHDVYVSDPLESGFCSPAAHRYKLSTAEFEDQLLCVASARPPAPLLPSDLLGSEVSGFTITVDDGGRSYYKEIADRLEALGWRGACFVSTDFIGRRGFLDREQIRELDARGHVIGSHSASHPTRFSACTREQMRLEWIRSREVLEDVLGHSVTVASLPGGYFSTDVAREAANAGVQLLFTSEPATTLRCVDGCVVAGRFTIRAGSRPDLAGAFVSPDSWARFSAWASWTAKGFLKPVLGSLYPRLTDWVLAHKA